MAPVTIYTRQFCGYCEAAKGLLSRKQVDFTEHDATFDADIRRSLVEKMGLDESANPTFPQIFIGDKLIGGCDDLFALEQNQSLDNLLAG